MLNNLFSAEVLQETLSIVQGQFLLAFWETLYVTIAAMFFAVVALYTPLIIFGEGLCALVSSYLLDKVINACSGEPGEEAGEAQ